MKVFFSDFFTKQSHILKKEAFTWTSLGWFHGCADFPAWGGGSRLQSHFRGCWWSVASGYLETRRISHYKQLFLTMLTQVFRMFPICWLNIHLFKWNVFTKLYRDLDVTVRCGRFKPLLVWTSTIFTYCDWMMHMAKHAYFFYLLLCSVRP